MDDKKNNLIKVTLEGVRIELPSQKPILLLKEDGGNRYLPIWIGPFEASAIALEMSHIKTPRPMTHDLIINIIRNLKIKIDNIEISDIRDNTFYAIINIRNLDRSLIKSIRDHRMQLLLLSGASAIYLLLNMFLIQED